MCACGKPECPSCKGKKTSFLKDWASKMTYTFTTPKDSYEEEKMLEAIQGFPSKVTPSESIPWDHPSADPFGDVYKALSKYKTLYYPPNGYPKKIKVTGTQLEHLKKAEAAGNSPLQKHVDPYSLSVFGVPIEVVEEEFKPVGYASGGYIPPAKGMGKDHLISWADEAQHFSAAAEETSKALQKFSKSLQKALKAWAAWHEVNLHKAYEAFSLENGCGPNPYSSKGPVPDMDKYEPEWTELPNDLMGAACVNTTKKNVEVGTWPSDVDDNLVCEECQDNGAVLSGTQKALLKAKHDKYWGKMSSFAQLYGAGPDAMKVYLDPASYTASYPVQQGTFKSNFPPLQQMPKVAQASTYTVVPKQVEELKAGDQVIVTVSEDGTLVIPEGMTGFVVRK